ncbi:RNA polymerase sigma24 factor [Nocardioides deserti]|nr:RNA polymerase sigma-70 factor [Nocardioides deserti]GGO78432.1 RNA polymerase sigma24 factor [Nocardioides deserti]
MTHAEPHAAAFAAYRNLLFTVAYEMLGSAADAEDVLQDAWLRWAEVDLAEVRDPRAYLVRVVTRQSLNRLRTLARRKESYVGPWLPEPLLTAPDVADDVELADSVSTAMLLVLETLTPTERAVFVLREVFDVPYDEIAAALDKSPAAVRQVAHRARGHVAARRPRVGVSRAEQRVVVDRFLAAAATGDLASLVEALAPDVVLTSDGGGLRSAALRPILGRDKVLRFLLGVMPTEGDLRMDVVEVNGAPALRFVVDGVLDTVATLLVEEGVVRGIYLVRNPEKLARLGHPGEPVVLAR